MTPRVNFQRTPLGAPCTCSNLSAATGVTSLRNNCSNTCQCSGFRECQLGARVYGFSCYVAGVSAKRRARTPCSSPRSRPTWPGGPWAACCALLALFPFLTPAFVCPVPSNVLLQIHPGGEKKPRRFGTQGHFLLGGREHLRFALHDCGWASPPARPRATGPPLPTAHQDQILRPALQQLGHDLGNRLQRIVHAQYTANDLL